MTRGQRGLAAMLAVILATLLALPAAAAGGPAAEGSTASPVFLLGLDGSLLRWTPGAAALEPIPIPWTPVNDLSPAGARDRVLILVDAPADPGSKRPKAEGLAILLDTAAPTPAEIKRIPFQGRGVKAAVTEDGRRAYIVAVASARAGGKNSAGASGRSLLHAVDLQAGKVTASASLDQTPNDLAVDPQGKRVFLSLQGRILTYSTSPLASSWYYRSPGINRDLVVRPGSDILYVERGREVAVFDPKDIAARTPQKRRSRDDDATTIVPLPVELAALSFSDDARTLLVFGRGDRFAFIDGEAKWGVILPDPPADLKGAELLRPVSFPLGTGDVVLASLPSRKAVKVATPPEFLSATVEDLQEQGEEVPAEEAPAAAPSPSPAPAPAPAPAPGAAVVPAEPAQSAATEASPGPVATSEKVLRGRVNGDRSRVQAIVIYGPDSIVREQARALPGPDGSWEAPLPPAGTYRLVPLGEGSKPLGSDPNFRTVTVAAEGLSGLDFKIPDGPVRR